MGNSSSTNVFLAVNDSRTRITAGSTLSGELRCPDGSVPNDLFSGVRLFFIGKEDVEVQYKDSGPGPKERGAYKAATRDIVRTLIPLDTSRHPVLAGRYPFTFDVPAHLPSSMHHKDGRGGYASIRYKVKLQLFGGANQEIPLEIRAQPPAAFPVPSVADPMPTRISFLYCLPQGNVTWAAAAEDTRVGVGESVTVNLGIRNDSFVPLERVTAKLKQSIEWHSSGHQSKTKSVLRSSGFDRTESMGPLAMGGALRAAQHQTVYDEVLSTVQEGRNQVTFSIPEYVPQSYAGRLIKVQYYVSVTAKTPSGFTSPKTHVPFEVVSPRDTPPIIISQRDTPPVVIAQAVPVPTAPPLPPGTFDADAGDEGGIGVLDSAENKSLLTAIHK